MKKLVALTLLLAGTTLANAQEKENYYTEKASDNLFVGVGVGAMSVINDGFNGWTPNFNIQFGKYLTPTWGVRAEIGGFQQKFDNHALSSVSGTDGAYNAKKSFVELNLDAMVNLSTLLAGYNEKRAVEVYAFAGPTVNLAGKNTQFTGESDAAGQMIVETVDGSKLRFGASAGLGIAYNLNSKWAINAEGRFGVTPSIFGDASTCRKAEATFRANIGVTYTLGGKKFKKVSDRVIEKEVIREVPKIVEKEVIKTVEASSQNVPAVAAAAVFFKINSTKLSDEGKVNIQLIAEAIKKSPATAKYYVTGSADKATGSAKRNQWLSEKRAQVVYDALVAEGVNPNMLEMKAEGGIAPKFFNKDRLSRVTVIQVK